MESLLSTIPDHVVETLREQNARLQQDLLLAHQRVLESQTRLTLITQAIASVVIDWDLTKNDFHRVNSPEEMMGYRNDEIATSLEEFRTGVHPEDLSHFDRSIQEWLQSKKTELRLDVRCLHKDGTYRDLRGQAIVIREEGTSRPLRVVASYSDVTPERDALRALQLSEERYRLATEAIQGIVFDWNLAANAVYRSSGVVRLLGFDREQIASSPQWWLDLIHPEDRAMVVASVQSFIEKGPLHGNMNYRIRHSLGHYLHVHSTFLAIRDESGRAARIVGCIVDLTPRIQAEEAQHTAERNFDQLFHDIPLGLVVISPEHQIIECNQAFAEMLGIPLTQLMGAPVSEIAGIAECMEQLSHSGTGNLFDHHDTFERQFLRQDGSRFPVQLRCKLIPYQNQVQPCLFGIMEDLTMRHRAEQDRQQLELQLQESAETG